MACSNNDQQNENDHKEDVSDENSVTQPENDDVSNEDDEVDQYKGVLESEEQEANDSEEKLSKENRGDQSESTENDPLTYFSTAEIEYARVWLQLGDTQDIDELIVKEISAGEPLNPADETSLYYPEDVIQLTGSRLVEGSITYSGNGDGTINLYKKVPARWDGKNPAGEEAYQIIIDDIERKAIDVGDDEKVEDLIYKLEIHS